MQCSAVLAYLLGSIPSAVWIGKRFHNIDVREHGSGNAGTTNTIRVLGWTTGIPVLIIDIAKGWLAAMLPVFFHLADPGSALLINLQIIAGIIAIIGHVFPVFAGFRGGKGRCNSFWSFSGFAAPAYSLLHGGFSCTVFHNGYCISLVNERRNSLPWFLFLFFDTPSVLFKIFAVLVGISLLVTHRKNIGRILRGEETKLLSSEKKKNLVKLPISFS